MRKNMYAETPRCAAAAAVVSAVVLRRPTKEYTHPYSMMHRRLPTAGIEVAPHYHQLLVTTLMPSRVFFVFLFFFCRESNGAVRCVFFFFFNFFLIVRCGAVRQNSTEPHRTVRKNRTVKSLVFFFLPPKEALATRIFTRVVLCAERDRVQVEDIVYSSSSRHGTYSAGMIEAACCSSG